MQNNKNDLTKHTNKRKYCRIIPPELLELRASQTGGFHVAVVDLSYSGISFINRAPLTSPLIKLHIPGETLLVEVQVVAATSTVYRCRLIHTTSNAILRVRPIIEGVRAATESTRIADTEIYRHRSGWLFKPHEGRAELGGRSLDLSDSLDAPDRLFVLSALSCFQEGERHVRSHMRALGQTLLP